MDETLKRRCLAVLQDPSNPRAMTALIKAVASQDPTMAEHLRHFRATGQSRPYGFVWSADGIELLGTQYVIVRAIPKPLGIRFACRCAGHALTYLEQAHPAEQSPRELIELVEAWLTHTVTKKVVREKFDELVEFGSRIDHEWHQAYGRGEFDSMSGNELTLSERPLFAVDVVGYAAQSVGLSKCSTAWLKSIDLTARAHIEVEALGQGKRAIKRAKAWQLRQLTDLIESANCTS